MKKVEKKDEKRITVRLPRGAWLSLRYLQETGQIESINTAIVRAVVKRYGVED